MKPGLSLIELMIGLFIASLIAVGLYNTFFLTNRIVERADEVINVSRSVAIIYNQFEKDLLGIILPEQEKNKKPEGQQGQQFSFDVLFKVTKKDEKLESLTFLTHNPLVTFQAGQLVQRRRFVRVFYRVVPAQEPDTFRLLRQESPTLDVKEFDLKENKIHAYQMADTIKSITMQWPLKNEKEPDKPLYQFATITLEFWHSHVRQRSTSVTMNFELPSFKDMARQLEEAKKAKEKKTETPSKKGSPEQETSKATTEQQKKEAEATKKTAQINQERIKTRDMLHEALTKIDVHIDVEAL